MSRGITTTAIILKEARRTSTGVVAFLLAGMLGGGGTIVLSLGPTATWIAAFIVLIAAWLAFGAWLLRGQQRVRAALHATGVPGSRVALHSFARVLCFSLPGSIIGGIAALETRLSPAYPPITLSQMALAGLTVPLLVLLVLTAAVLACSPVGTEDAT